MPLADTLKKKGLTSLNSPPLWKGPMTDGVTQSMLSNYLVCKERFRIGVIEGLGPIDRFNKGLEYGQMWHLCEEMYAAGQDWKEPLKTYCRELCKRFKESQEEIDKWYRVCLVQFPVYLDYWKKHPDVKSRENLLPEVSFKIPYRLPDMRTVYLRGKWDSVDLIGKGKQKKIYLQENKTKGEIDEEQLRRILGSGFELQTMLYLTALSSEGAREAHPELENFKVAGVRYNVIRRPLSGGKGSIRQKKGSKNVRPETAEEFYARLRDDYIAQEPEYFFMRWKVEVSKKDLERFQGEVLNPLLMEVADNYEWWDYCNEENESTFNTKLRAEVFPDHSTYHYRYPYGIYNPIDKRGEGDLDHYVNTGSNVGLERKKTLFPELEEEQL